MINGIQWDNLNVIRDEVYKFWVIIGVGIRTSRKQ